VVGLVLLVISLVWTTYNSGTYYLLRLNTVSFVFFLHCPFFFLVRKIPVDTGTGRSVDLMSVATGGAKPKDGTVHTLTVEATTYNVAGMRSLFFQVSLVFLLICGYYAMVRLLLL